MVHLFRLRNSLHGRNKLGVFLQSFNSLSDPSHWPVDKSEFYFLPSLSPILQILHRTQNTDWDAMECCSDTSDGRSAWHDDLCVMYVMYPRDVQC